MANIGTAEDISNDEMKKSLRLLLLQAWRERWTDIEWGIQLKKHIPFGVSGDIYGLSELLLSQALVGFSPNSLMLTYLKNAVSCQAVSLAATLTAIVRRDDITRPHCTKSLMKIVNEFLPHAIHYGGTEDPLTMSKCLLMAIKWAFSCSHKSLQQLADGRQQEEFITILELMCQMLQIVLNDNYSRALIAIAVSENGDLYREISQTESNVRGTLTQLPNTLISPNLRQNVDKSLKLLSRINEIGVQTSGILIDNFLLNPSVNAIVQFEATLNPTGAIEPVVDLLLLVEKLQSLSRETLICDIVRAGFLGIIDVVHGPNELQWVAFTYWKIPQILVKLQSQSPNSMEDTERAFARLLSYCSLIEALESSYVNCDCMHLLLDMMTKNGLLSEQQVEALLESRQPVENLKKTGETTVQATPNLILRAEPTVASILKTLDADYTKNQEALLGVLCHMLSGKSFELILAAAAANGKLRSFALKVVKFNEFAKSSPGEGSKGSVARSLLFDISFLMLCHMTQFYGLEIIEDKESNSEAFFTQWASKFLPLDGQYKSMDSYRVSDSSKIDLLLSQFNVGGELKTTLVKWFDVCYTAPLAIREVLRAWEAGVIQQDVVKNIIDNVKSRLCCLPVVVCAWLCSYMNVIPEISREKPKQIVEMIINSDSPPENPSQSYNERSHLMTTICKIMIKGPIMGFDCVESTVLGENTAMDLLTKTLHRVYKEGCLRQESVRALDQLLKVGGVEWFCDTVVHTMLTSHSHPEDLSQDVSVTIGIFQLNIEQLSLCFLNHLLPKLLQGTEYKLQLLVDPKGKALAQFTIMVICTAIQMRPYQHKYPTILKRGTPVIKQDMSFEEIKEADEPKPAKQRKEEVLTLQSEFNFDIQESLEDSDHMPYDTKDPLNQSIIKLFSLFNAIIHESVLSPRTSFIHQFMKLTVKSGPHTRYILQFMPSNMVQQLQRSMAGVVTLEIILMISDLSSVRGRCIAANAVCQASRVQAFKKKL